MERAREDSAVKKEVLGARKKPYESPILTLHGNVEKTTKVLRLTVGKKQGSDFG